jgi:hypothetical protein
MTKINTENGLKLIIFPYRKDLSLKTQHPSSRSLISDATKEYKK